ncbi:MAG: response regulator [Planctomycetaceae bacterium]
MNKPAVLIIEDEVPILEVLSYNLQKHGFDVYTATDGQSGLQQARTVLPDLIVLDLMIPVIEGMEVCRQLRSDPRTQAIRILMLTAKGEESDEVLAFNMGADDYVTKPFRMKPLIERIKVQLRRPAAARGSSDIVSVDGVEMNRLEHKASLDNRELALTPTEFRLLWTLARQPGRTFNRYELMDSARGTDANSLERTIDVHIRSLRKKLGKREDLIETVRGIGYRFHSQRSTNAASPQR